MARAAARQISFADIELIRQPLKFLDNQHEMLERCGATRARFEEASQGLRGLTAPLVLHSRVLKRIKN